MPLRPRLFLVTALLLFGASAARAEVRVRDSEGAQFFESKVRPVLVERCYGCHSAGAKKLKGGLRLDARAAVLKGGDNGPAIVAEHPEQSRLIEAVSYQNVDLQMPPKGRLTDQQIADLTAWVKMGAPWPESSSAAAPPASGAPTVAAFDLAKRKAEHWAWQPVRARPAPAVKDGAWVKDPVDAFVLAGLEAKGLRPAATADKRTLIRRATFDLTGLPPTPAEVEAFLSDASPDAFVKVVDRLLASPHFGERWGRHWLDLVRYAETRGHEFDYDAPNAWQYRDYVIRALNADVPYDRFVTEQIAGDVLPDPRIDPKTQTNESLVATGFWFLGEWLHSPVDLRQDEADRVDNQIDVMGKTFLALTVGCARCHDHKFDAISTKDYYALAGVLHGAGYRDAKFQWQAHNADVARRLRELRGETRDKVRDAIGVETRPAPAAESVTPSAAAAVVVDYNAPRRGDWITEGLAFGDGPTRAGELLLGPAAAHPLAVEPRGAARSDRTDPSLPGLLRTPTFTVTAPKLWLRVAGSGKAFVEIDGHRMVEGPLHQVSKQTIKAGKHFAWHVVDLSPYAGQRAHVEFTAGGPDGYIAVQGVWQGLNTEPALVGATQVSPSADRADDAEGRERVEQIFDDYQARRRELLSQIKDSPAAMAMLEANGVDEYVFIRGSHKSRGETVPRRFLEALGGTDQPPVEHGSGRLELARQIASPANPLTARVMVNRVWHHLFGRGIVASPDNFGVLGQAPSHSELLDHLADRFVKEGWSVKRLIREIVLSSTYQMSSRPTDAQADQLDPQNILLHRQNVRRLEGEAIRDAILAVSGRLDPTAYGPSVEVHLTPFMDGRGRPKESGPLDGNGRRSVYTKIRRNFLPPMMLAFDMPAPFNTMGRRTVSNVPAQALILMNDPFVIEQAKRWAERVLTEKDLTPEQHITKMYETAFARQPSEEEVAEAKAFLEGQGEQLGVAPAARDDDARVWADLAHVLLNVKEFTFVN